MRLPTAIRYLSPLAASALLSISACGDETTPVECGEGTALNGAGTACEPTAEPIVCAAGTRLEGGECVPGFDEVTCGADTVLVDGACELENTPVTCAAGTTLDAGTCIPSDGACSAGTLLDATGVCIPDTSVVCGTNTTPDANGVCQPDAGICAAGTTFDPATGSCSPDVVCRADQIAMGGNCLSAEEVDAANATASETTPDSNDSAFGGTPESLTLPAVGDSVIFTGVVDAPTDLDSDGTVDQDVDEWSFDGTAGQVVGVYVRQTGDLSFGFTVTGPSGYVRTSPLFFDAEPRRYVLLPYDGTYTIAIAPQPFVDGADAGPAGGAAEQYVAALENVGPLTASDLATDSTASGNV